MKIIINYLYFYFTKKKTKFFQPKINHYKYYYYYGLKIKKDKRPVFFIIENISTLYFLLHQTNSVCLFWFKHTPTPIAVCCIAFFHIFSQKFALSFLFSFINLIIFLYNNKIINK